MATLRILRKKTLPPTLGYFLLVVVKSRDQINCMNYTNSPLTSNKSQKMTHIYALLILFLVTKVILCKWIMKELCWIPFMFTQ